MQIVPESLRCVEGLQLALRLVVPNDAAFIHCLRTDSALNAHLSEVRGTIEDQRRWIENYKIREAAGREYYYVIERLSDRVPCGLVRLYEIKSERLTWGSWILNDGKPRKAALESAFLSFSVAFDRLRKMHAKIDVRRENARAIAFYRRFGFDEKGADAHNIYFDYTRRQFERDRSRHLEVLVEHENI